MLMVDEKFNSDSYIWERETYFLFTVFLENKYNINVLKPWVYAYSVSNFIPAWLAGLLTCIFTTAKNNEESKWHTFMARSAIRSLDLIEHAYTP